MKEIDLDPREWTSRRPANEMPPRPREPVFSKGALPTLVMVLTALTLHFIVRYFAAR